MSSQTIHPTAVIHEAAIVEPGAVLGAGTIVHAHAFVGPDVRLGEGCWVGPHAVVSGHVQAGARNRFFPFSSVGAMSQDLWDDGDIAWVCMGDDNVIREGVTINGGTSKEFRCTSLGNHNNIMAGCHIAHDCVVGDHVTLANHALLGGHVRIRDRASIGGASAVHHFVTVGRNSYIGGMTRVVHDVPAWMLCDGNPARVKSVNVVGARRAGLPDEHIAALREMYKRIFRNDAAPRSETRRRLAATADLPTCVKEVLADLERQASGHKGRHLERFRRDDRTVDTDALEAADRPRHIPDTGK